MRAGAILRVLTKDVTFAIPRSRTPLPGRISILQAVEVGARNQRELLCLTAHGQPRRKMPLLTGQEQSEQMGTYWTMGFESFQAVYSAIHG